MPSGTFTEKKNGCPLVQKSLRNASSPPRLIVSIFPPGSKPKGNKPKQPPPGEPFVSAQVATLFDKQGNVLAERTLKDFLKRRFDKLRDLDSHFCWLEGELGVPGRRPRITDSNQVEFETVEPKTFRLDF